MSTRALQIGAIVVGVIAITLAVAYIIRAGGNFRFDLASESSVPVANDRDSTTELPKTQNTEQPLTIAVTTPTTAVAARVNSNQARNSITIQPPTTPEAKPTDIESASDSTPTSRQLAQSATQSPEIALPAIISAQGIVEEANETEQTDTTQVVEPSLPVPQSRAFARIDESSLAQSLPITTTVSLTKTDQVIDPTPERPNFRATLDAITGATPAPTATLDPAATPTTVIVNPQPTEGTDTERTDTVLEDSTPNTENTPSAGASLPGDNVESEATVEITGEDNEEAVLGTQTPEPDSDIQQEDEPASTTLDRPNFRATLDAVTGNIATSTPTIPRSEGQAKGGTGVTSIPATTPATAVETLASPDGMGQPVIIIEGSDSTGETDRGETSGPPTAIEEALLYLAPSFDTEIVGSVQPGQPLEIVARLTTGEWYLLTDASWINAASVVNGPGALPLVVPTLTPTPTQTPTPTGTPTPTATSEIPPTPTPTPTSLDEVICACESDQYECLGSSFPVQADAQACFEYCFRQTGMDIHNLDPNENGQACENLQ